ncbi:MAG: DNA-3-methyladenine glycosylase 2 family protein, partial [Candidatus Eremiobacteraeota bacterium]|nr:DNA-3-methyladenine glycosylase 2 family protein [Candidatus Eremiobacteraeota bacterium]MBV9263496.1 DNA-3-methyladenine glycosylase 2 family protein [Candidatus Eremiobacteraeota bacterium]
LHHGRGVVTLAVRQRDAGTIELRCTGADPSRYAPAVERLLGTNVDLSDWYARARRVPWLRRLADGLRGVKPPRYPTLWEACAHAIVFQQISIYAAAAIMRRAIERLAGAVCAPGVRCVAFPPPARWLECEDEDLFVAGLSRNKVAHLRGTAQAFLDGRVDEAELAGLPTSEAAARLAEIRGIGPWSASVAMLRGLGRLDVFPLRDSGVARTLTLLAGTANVDQEELLERLGPVRGMLYYHLLLGRLAALNDHPVRRRAPHD